MAQKCVHRKIKIKKYRIDFDTFLITNCRIEKKAIKKTIFKCIFYKNPNSLFHHDKHVEQLDFDLFNLFLTHYSYIANNRILNCVYKAKQVA